MEDMVFFKVFSRIQKTTKVVCLIKMAASYVTYSSL